MNVSKIYAKTLKQEMAGILVGKEDKGGQRTIFFNAKEKHIFWMRIMAAVEV